MKYYQIYRDDLDGTENGYTHIFNRLAKIGCEIDLMEIQNSRDQIVILLDDAESPSERTEIKIGFSAFSHKPSFIHVSATTQSRCIEVYNALILEDTREGGN